MPPKKGKKGKGKSKSKGKGKGKGKKKDKKFSDTALAVANTRIWEARLDATEKSRQEFRENVKHLALENEALQRQMLQSEKDTIDVITFLKKEDQSKEDLIAKLQKQLKDTRRESRKEKQQIIEDFTTRLNELETSLAEKTDEVKMMQSELKLVKEFRRKRGQMQKELDEIKEEMFLSNKEHSEQLQRMEHKFFEEKIRLQHEASQKIAELAERAHTEAISELDETTRSVYKENVRVTEALSYHMKESDELKLERDTLLKENKSLKGDKELNVMMIQEKVAENAQLKEQIKRAQDKIQSLEGSLSHVVREFEQERQIVVRTAHIETEAGKVEIAKLMRTIELQSKEMRKVKRLAKTILDQRTEMEQFFLDSLEIVKKEIIANRAKYMQDAAAMYHKKMMDAHANRAEYPKVRTFKASDTSTNTVYSDLKAAEAWTGLSGKVDVSELTWEQRERVLRLLFAKMNGARVRSKPPIDFGPPASLRSPVSISGKDTESLAIEGPPPAEPVAFLTQQNIDESAMKVTGDKHSKTTQPVLPDLAQLSLTVAAIDTRQEPTTAGAT